MGEYAGMRWFKCDFQVQTPEDSRHWADKETKLLEPRKEHDLREKAKVYLRRCHEVGLQVIGVTDHNFSSRTNVEELFLFHLIKQNEPVATELGVSPLHIFPGFEIDIGYHLLCLFNPVPKAEELSRISNVLSKLGLVETERFEAGEPRPLRKEDAPVPLRTVLRTVQKEADGIVIGAHAFSDSGICNDAAHINDFLLEDLLCVEVVNYPLKHKEANFLGGKEPKWRRASKRQPAGIRSSDAKSLTVGEDGLPQKNSLGYRHTWMKMSSPSIEAIRQACLDSDSRISLEDTSPEKRQKHPRIVKLEVKGAAFVADQTIEFSPALNCLIGGRGSGKSSLLEYLRFALGTESERALPADVREKLVLLRTTIGSTTGELRVTFESQPGVTDTVLLGPGAQPQRIEGREVVDLKTVLDQLHVQFFSQGELSRLTKPGHNQVLRVVDAACGEPLIALNFAEASLRGELEQLSSVAHRAKALGADVSRLTQEVTELDRQWQAHQDIKVEAQNHQRAQKVRIYANQTLSEAQGVAKRISTQAGLDENSDLWPPNPEERWPSPEWFAEIEKRVKDANAQLRADLAEASANFIRRIEAAFSDEAGWTEVSKKLTEVESTFLHACTEKGLLPSDLSKLQQVDALRQAKAEELSKTVKELMRLTSIAADREAKLGSLHMLWHQQFAVRSRACAEIQKRSPSTKVSVGYMADRLSFRSIWRQLQPSDSRTRLGRNWEDIGDTVFEVYQNQDAHSPWEVVEQWKQDKDGPPAEVTALTAEMLRYLESVEMQPHWEKVRATRVNDLIDVELSRADGTVAGNMSGTDGKLLSEGQRNTALLNLMLAQGEGPIVIDQPEDELDSNYIFSDLVPLIREVKGHRQLIVATHNANLPVNADAELIYAVEAKDAKGQCLVEGGLDRPEVTKAVLEILEGSERAFRLRSEKYRF